MLWSAGKLDLSAEVLLVLVTPLYISTIMTRAIGLYGIAIAALYWWAQVMITLEIGPPKFG
jgi:hypothetical protein